MGGVGRESWGVGVVGDAGVVGCGGKGMLHLCIPMQ